MDVKIAWGVDETGLLVHISDAANGKSCDCSCPYCGMPLVACNNGHIAHHFKHAANTSCSFSEHRGETALHRAAKQLLVEAARRGEQISVPNKRRYELRRGLVKPRPDAGDFEASMLMSLCGGQQEASLPSGQRADVLLTLSSGDQLSVEFAVSNRKKKPDIERFLNAGLDVLEIDLSHLRWNTDKSELLRSVLSSAPRMWLVANGLYVAPHSIKIESKMHRYNEYLLDKKIERWMNVAGYRDRFVEMINSRSRDLRWPAISSEKKLTKDGVTLRASVNESPQLISISDWCTLSVDSETDLGTSWLATGRINKNVEVSVLFTTDKCEKVGGDEDGEGALSVNRPLLRVLVSDFSKLSYSLTWENIAHWQKAAESRALSQLKARVNNLSVLIPVKGALEVTFERSADDEKLQFMASHFNLSDIPDSYLSKSPHWRTSNALWMSLIWYFILPFTDKVSASTLAMDRWLSIILGWSVDVLESGYGRRQRDIAMWLEYLSSVTEIKKDGGGWYRVNMTESAPIPWDLR